MKSLPKNLFFGLDSLIELWVKCFAHGRFFYNRYYTYCNFYIITVNLVCTLLPDCFGRDLRGNMFECDCRAKWLIDWLKQSNATVSDVYCAGPADRKGMRLKDVPDQQKECLSTGNQYQKATMYLIIEITYTVMVFNNSR